MRSDVFDYPLIKSLPKPNITRLLSWLKTRWGHYFFPAIFYVVWTVYGWYRKYRYLGIRYFIRDWGQSLYHIMSPLPWIQSQLEIERISLRESLKESLQLSDSPSQIKLPVEGVSSDKIIKFVSNVSNIEKQTWEQGYCSGCVYHGEPSHLKLLDKVSSMYNISNPLHSDIWPSLRKMEGEIVSMTSQLLGGDVCPEVCGSTTYGGTESIILAVKAHRNWAAVNKVVDERMQVIIPTTAHAAFLKACDLLQLEARLVEVDPVTHQVDPSNVESMIEPNTILIIASAPNFHSGVIDPITKLGQIADKYNIGLHVDCCLGGFFLPFMRDLGHFVPQFDFRVRGVTSMSVDTHKYGYAPKGTSVVLFKSQSLRHDMYFCYPDWSGGLYCTPTLAGSRPGSTIAGCWASLVNLGNSGYLTITREIIATREYIVKQITERVPEITILFGAPTMIIALSSTICNIYSIGDGMSKKGWHLNQLQHPNAIHLCLTRLHNGPGISDKFIDDLVDVVGNITSNGDTASNAGKASVYGMTQSLPDGPVDELLKMYIDMVLDE